MMRGRSPVSETYKQRVLVTGGAGLIGSTIIDQLTTTGDSEIIVFDNFVRGRMPNLAGALETGKVRVVEGDIRDREAVADVMEGIDLVYHMAAIRITQCAEDPRLALEVMADGTFNVLDAAVTANVGKVVAASSASIYGLAEQFPTREDHHPYGNRTIYGAAKIFNEGLLRSFNEMYGLKYAAMRYFNVYGPRMDIHGVYTEVLIRWMALIEKGEPPVIFGDGAQTMDFVYISDIARATILAAESTASDDVFNVASGTETSLSELALTLIRAMGSTVEPTYVEQPNRPEVSRRLADTTKAKELIGFKTEVPLQEGLSRLIEWWRSERLQTESD
ncbi:MAG: NAD-dependent epimerase/dehydratase family protein [Acidimicrobiia bacterium]|nr:MAG: NAD-dependent epimerase/dehydratase family protein [Acidimicrobiia bacterium]